MRFPDSRLISTLAVLAIAQLVGWGTVALPSVMGHRIAADLHLTIETVFAGTSVLYVVIGILSPFLRGPFARFGARRVMIAGTIVSGIAFALMSIASGPVSYFAAWVVLGTGGAATLTTPAYILLNESAGSNAKGSIGALMLVTGLPNSAFWPIAGFLAGTYGWRTACLIYAGMMLLVCLPLYTFGLPPRTTAASGPANSKAAMSVEAARKSTFWMVAAAIAFNAFVTFGMSAILIELLRAEGLREAEAIAFGSALGFIQIGARGLDLVGGNRWDGLTTALVAGLMLPAALLFSAAAGTSPWSIAAFIFLYGLASGALAVSRATLPLVFYDKQDYAAAAARIALPLNLLAALSPPVLVGLLHRLGPDAVLVFAALCSCCAFLLLLGLRRRRPAAVAAPA